MLEQAAHNLAQYLLAHPNMGGLFTFVISFLESLAVIGTIVPGSITMTAVGILVGMSILPPGMTLLWAVMGAFLGDYLGYWIGLHYNERLRNMWPFKTRPNWLAAGERFFHKHGGKSIIIGRFVGPLRSLIPMIAGLLHLNWLRFVIAAIPSAALWAIVYMLPGYLLGALSLQLPPKVATKFILILLSIIVVLAVFAWLIKYLYLKFRTLCSNWIKRVWDRSIAKHNTMGLMLEKLAGKHRNDYHQLIWLLIGTFFLILFLFVFISVIQHDPLTNLNRPLFEFLRSIRQTTMDRIFVGMTLLGDGRVLITSGLCIFVWFLWKHYYREAIHWLIAILIAMFVPNSFKYVLYFPRPSGLAASIPSSSFPSGHVFLAFMFFGFLASIISSHLRHRYRRYPYLFATVIVFLIGFSRLYLGAHWLSDVLASFCLGFVFLAILTISYRRNIKPINTLQLAAFSLIMTSILWMGTLTFTFQKNLAHYALLWPSQMISETSWWGRENPALPIFRQNRLGKPSEPMNIEYAGEIYQLKNILKNQGWSANPDLDLIKKTLEKLVHTQNTFSTFLPSLYLNNPPVLFMIKDLPDRKLILKMWHSNVYLMQSWQALYIGTIVQYQLDTTHEKILYSFNSTDELLPFLNRPHWRVNSILIQDIPPKLQKKNWEGEILQIKAPSFY